MTYVSKALFAAAALCAAVGPAVAAGPAKNLLFFGNSFTIGNGSASVSSNPFVPSIVRNIATAAGQTTPNVYFQVAGGQNFDYHINKIKSDGSAGVVRTALPAGTAWDSVVLQEFSTKPTTHSADGNVPDFRNDSVTLYGQVRATSPAVKAVLFETWARGYGHPFYNPASADYQPTLVNPNTMQQQLRTNYALADADLDAAFGGNTSAVAPVGDAFAYGNFANLYNGDFYHANNRGSLLAAMSLYSTIYQDNVSDINFASVAAGLGLTAADAATLATWSDAVTPVPEPAAVGVVVVVVGLVATRRTRRGPGGTRS